MRTIEDTLSLWQSGLLTSAQIAHWADRQIEICESPSPELVSLSLYGAEYCLSNNYPNLLTRPAPLSYQEEFAVRAASTDLQDDTSALKFISWAAAQLPDAEGTTPMRTLGYKLDHWLNDCNDAPGALKVLRAELPALLSEYNQLALKYSDAEA